jgi:DnaJ domain
MVYSSLQLSKLQTWLANQEVKTRSSLRSWIPDVGTLPDIAIRTKVAALINEYQQQPWYLRWWRWLTQPVGSWWIWRLVDMTKESIASAPNGMVLSSYLRSIASNRGWSWGSWYLNYCAKKIKQEWQRNQGSAQAESLEPKEMLIDLIYKLLLRLEGLEAISQTNEEGSQLRQEDYQSRFDMAKEIVMPQNNTACGWLGRHCQHTDTRRKLYGTLLHRLLKQLLIDCRQDQPVEDHLNLLSQLLEEGLLLGDKDGSRHTFSRYQVVWDHYRDLAGNLTDWAQSISNNEPTTSDNALTKDWLAVALHLHEGWKFWRSNEDHNDYKAQPFQHNKWLVIEARVNKFEQRIDATLRQVKNTIVDKARKSNPAHIDQDRDIRKKLKDIKQALKQVLVLQIINEAEQTFGSIANNFEEVIKLVAVGNAKVTDKPPQVAPEKDISKFQLSGLKAKSACHKLCLDPEEYLSINDIRKAFREQALLCHPDKAQANGWNQEQTKNAEERFNALREATETLISEIEQQQHIASNPAEDDQSVRITQLSEDCDLLRKELDEIKTEFYRTQADFEEYSKAAQQETELQMQQLEDRLNQKFSLAATMINGPQEKIVSQSSNDTNQIESDVASSSQRKLI